MGTPVTEIFADAIPYSAAFGMPAIVISFACGIPLGIEAAKKQGKAADRIINGFNLFISAVPALILVLGIYLLAVMGFGTSTTFASGSF
jgi:oligopeptide transport system permease protein